MKDTDFERFSEKVTQLASNEGYFLRFYEIASDYPSYRAAWEALEDERESVGLPERYSSYESFKRGKSYHYPQLIRVNSQGNE